MLINNFCSYVFGASCRNRKYFKKMCFNRWRLGFWSETARIVKSQKATVFQSLMFLLSMKSSKSQHLFRMMGEWGQMISKFLNMSRMASYTWSSVSISRILIMLNSLKLSSMESGYSTIYSRIMLKKLIILQVRLGCLKVSKRGVSFAHTSLNRPA